MGCRFGIKKVWNLYRNLIESVSPFKLLAEKSSDVKPTICNHDKYEVTYLYKRHPEPLHLLIHKHVVDVRQV
jgi:hypothetical protein